MQYKNVGLWLVRHVKITWVHRMDRGTAVEQSAPPVRYGVRRIEDLDLQCELCARADRGR
jgi:hypothetical protein